MNVIFIYGGPIVWVLLLLLFASCVLYFERFLELRRSHIDSQDFIKGLINILQTGNIEEAVMICEDTMAPVANVASVAVKQMNFGHEAVREAAYAQARVEVGRLQRRLETLSVIGDLSPLIGLFGTIIGFIQVVLTINSQSVVARFDLIGSAMPALLSAAMGIFVSIVVSVLFASLKFRFNKIVLELDAATTQIVDQVASFGVKDND
jgi:biopolymer transport protein ExbB